MVTLTTSVENAKLNEEEINNEVSHKLQIFKN
jgi:hypothetical protein